MIAASEFVGCRWIILIGLVHIMEGCYLTGHCTPSHTDSLALFASLDVKQATPVVSQPCQGNPLLLAALGKTCLSRCKLHFPLVKANCSVSMHFKCLGSPCFASLPADDALKYKSSDLANPKIEALSGRIISQLS